MIARSRAVTTGIAAALILSQSLVVFLPQARAQQGQAAPAAVDFKFSFGPGRLAPDAVRVLPSTVYSHELGYGFEPGASIQCLDRGAADASRSHFCTSDKPFFFSVDVPEGDYDVTIVLGDPQGQSVATVKAESRRLLIVKSETSAGQFDTRSFTVNVRYPEIAGGGRVSLKPRELATWDWDHKLTLEFNNKRPCVVSLEIKKAERAVTVYLAGDSTVVDQAVEPWCAWGQMLPLFFKPGVSIANNAESGETLKAFISEYRFAKIMSTIKPGDYLFIQFTHNDQKPGPDHVDAFTDYKSFLKLYINEARLHGATPVLVTSMNRRTFGPDGKITNSMGDYPEAMRQTAKEENVALIDLNAMSKILYEAWGPENSVKAFVQYPAGTFPGQTQELKDNTHFNSYGAYELAKCIVEGIKSNQLGIAQYLLGDTAPFDPAHPDPFEDWHLPMSPFSTPTAPAGR